MNVESLRAMLDIQLLRGFSGQEANTESGNPLFEEMLKSFVEETGNPSAPQPLNSLGAILNRSQNFGAIAHKLTGAIEMDADMPKTGASYGVTAPNSIAQIIQKAAETYKLPAKLIESVIKHESNFNPDAVSRAGASGLMQLMPGTARGLGVTNILDPLQNVMAGSKYLKSMMDKYNGDIKLALAAYNAGPGNVDKYGGIPPFKETQAYVKKVSGSFLA